MITPPTWVDDYVGIPYLAAGRDRSEGLDCWGLVRLVLKERYDTEVPDYPGWRNRGDDAVTVEVSTLAEADPRWVKVPKPQPGDVVLLRVRGLPVHVGLIVADGWMLHAHEGCDAALERLDSARWRSRILAYGRWTPDVEADLESGPDDPASTVQISTPFSRRPLQAVVPEGATIADIVAIAELGPIKVSVWIGVDEVPENLWLRVRPKKGVTVTLRLPLHGGGGGGGGGSKNILRTVAQIAIMAVASFYLAPLVVGALGVEGFAAAVVTAAVTTGAGMLGSMLINAIAPPPKPSLPSFSFSNDSLGANVYSVSGTQNRANPWGAVPLLLGTIRVVPPLGAPQYTEISGDDQYLRALFVVGYGPISLSDIWIDKTPIAEFEGVEIETRDGLPSDTPVTLYPGSVTEDGFSVDLRGLNGTTSTRRSATNSTELSVDITATQGLGWVNSSSGAKSSLTVNVLIEYAPVGGSFTTVTTLAMTDKEFRTRRFSYRWTVTRGQYDVRLKWVSTDGVGSSSQTIDTVVWTALRSINGDDPIKLPNLAKIALRIKATGQLNGVISELSVLGRSRLPDWNGSVWTETATANPASVFRYLLTGSATKKTVASTRIDDTGLIAWRSFCNTNGFTYSGYWTSGRSLADALREVAAAGRAAPTIRDGKYGVIIDQPQSSAVQLFTPRNSWGFKGSKQFLDAPHALKVAFTNKNQNYEADELIVYADGYTSVNATKFDRLNLPGVTDPTIVYKLARWHLATPTLRPERWELMVDVESLAATRGDLVRIQHDAMLVGLGWGRVKSVTLNGSSQVTSITLDTSWPIEVGKSYMLAVRRDVNDIRRFQVSPSAGTTAVMPVTTPATGLAAVGDLVAIGELNKETIEAIIFSVEGAENMTARLTLVPAAPGLATVDSQPVPAFSSLISARAVWVPPIPDVPNVISVRSDENVLLVGADGTLTPRVVIKVLTPAAKNTVIDSLQVRWRNSVGVWIYSPFFSGEATDLSITEISEGDVIDIQVRAISTVGTQSDWSSTITHTVIGQTSLPDDVTATRLDGEILSWTYVNPPLDLAGFKVRYRSSGTDWASAAEIPGTLTLPRIDLTGIVPRGALTLLVKAIDRGGRVSANAGTITRTSGGRTLGVIIGSQAEAPTFGGTKTGCTVVSSTLRPDDVSGSLFLPTSGATFLPVGSDFFLPGEYATMTYVWTYVVGSTLVPGSVTIAATVANGVPWTLEYRTTPGSGAWLVWPGEIAAATGTLEFRLTVTGGASRGDVSELTVQVDAPEVSERLTNVSISSGGTNLPVTKTYRAITSVQMTPIGSAARTAVRIDSALTGPLVKVFDASGTAVSGTVDADVRGY